MRGVRVAIVFAIAFAGLAAATAADPASELPARVDSFDEPELPERIAACDVLIRKHPQRADAYLRRAELRSQLQAFIGRPQVRAAMPAGRLKLILEVSDSKAALKDLNEAERLGLKSNSLYVERAEQFHRLGEYRKALAEYDRAFELQGFGEIESALRVSRKLGDDQITLDLLNRYLNSRPKDFRPTNWDIDKMNERAALIFKLGKPEDQIRILRERMAVGPVTYDQMYQLEEVLRTHRPNQIEEFYRGWIAKDPTYGDEKDARRSYPLIRLAEFSIKELKYQEAFDALTAAAKWAPLYEYERMQLQRILDKSSDPVDVLARAAAYRYFYGQGMALDMYAELAERFPRSARLLCERAMATLELGVPEGAAEDIAAAEKLEPNSAYVHAARGALAQSARDYKTALTEYEKAFALNPYMGGLRSRIGTMKDALRLRSKFDVHYDEEEAMILDQRGLAFSFTMQMPPSDIDQKAMDFSLAYPITSDERNAVARSRWWVGDVRGAIELVRRPSIPESLVPMQAYFLLNLGDYVGAAKMSNPDESVGRLATARRDGKFDWRLYMKDADTFRSGLWNQPVPPAESRRLLFRAMQKRLESPECAEDFLLCSLHEEAWSQDKADNPAEHTRLARANLDRAARSKSLAALDPLNAASKWLPRTIAERRKKLGGTP